jgi:hypothetical protein
MAWHFLSGETRDLHGRWTSEHNIKAAIDDGVTNGHITRPEGSAAKGVIDKQPEDSALKGPHTLADHLKGLANALRMKAVKADKTNLSSVAKQRRREARQLEVIHRAITGEEKRTVLTAPRFKSSSTGIKEFLDQRPEVAKAEKVVVKKAEPKIEKPIESATQPKLAMPARVRAVHDVLKQRHPVSEGYAADAVKVKKNVNDIYTLEVHHPDKHVEKWKMNMKGALVDANGKPAAKLLEAARKSKHWK